MIESRERVREMRELVDAAIAYDELGDYARAGALSAEAAILLSDYVANMGHADVQTAQRMAREHNRMFDLVEKHLPEGFGYQ